jgi:hypothetical protein
MTVPLRLEPLEPRDVPSTSGIPLPDGQHLTLSFAPDGTSKLDVAANLNSALFAHDQVRVGVRPKDPTSAPDATVPLSGATPPAAQTAQPLGSPTGAPVTSAGPTSTAIPERAPAPREATAQRIPPGASSQPAGVFVPPIQSRTDPVDTVWYMRRY